MPYHVEWFIPDHVVYERFVGHITMPDIEEASAAAQQLQQTLSSGMVHFLVDVRETTRIDVTLNSLRTANIGGKTETTGWIVLVTGHNRTIMQFVKFVSVAIAQIFGIRVRVFNDMDQALNFLSEIDEALAKRLI